MKSSIFKLLLLSAALSGQGLIIHPAWSVEFTQYAAAPKVSTDKNNSSNKPSAKKCEKIFGDPIC